MKFVRSSEFGFATILAQEGMVSKNQSRRFSIVHHVPRYSLMLLQAVRSPLLIYFAVAGNSVLVFSAVAFFHFEKGNNPHVHTFFDAIWWAFNTVSTVGLGDIYPVTFPGRVVAIVLMVVGVVLFVGFTAILISMISALAAKEIVENETITAREYQNLMHELKKLSEKIEKLSSQN
jgi:voltage-gated potassium channel